MRRFLMLLAAGSLWMGGFVMRAADTMPAPDGRDWRYVLSIHDIARADDDERLAALVNGNPDRAKLRLADGRTPVHVAAEAGAVKSLRVLGKAGADMNIYDGSGRTALSIATGMNFATTVKALIEAGADVGREGVAEGDVARPALAIAARRGFIDVMKVLLDAKADVNQRGKDGGTALTTAAAAGRWDAVNLLLDRGADVNAQDSAGVTTLLFATEAGNVKAVETLLAKGADAKLVDKKGRAVLSLTRDPALWKMLVAKGADVNVVVGGSTPLQYFIAEADAGLVKAWLEYKPDPMVTDRKGLTAKELARKFAAGDGTPARKEIARVLEEYQRKYVEEMERAAGAGTQPG